MNSTSTKHPLYINAIALLHASRVILPFHGPCELTHVDL
jgi:hypothetical protein